MRSDERNKFIEQHYGLVHACCRRFVGRGVEYEDMFQVGSIGLIKAADAFDDSRGVCFSTYAVPVILGEIKRIFRDGGTVKVSRTLRERYMKISAMRERLLGQTGREPTLSELATELSLTEEETAEAVASAQPVLSLFAENGRDGSAPEPPVCCEQELFDRLAVDEIKSSLSDEDWQLLRLRYFGDRTQSETALLLKMTQVGVSRRERALLSELKRKFE